MTAVRVQSGAVNSGKLARSDDEGAERARRAGSGVAIGRALSVPDGRGQMLRGEDRREKAGLP